jgi:hypothetical protein
MRKRAGSHSRRSTLNIVSDELPVEYVYNLRDVLDVTDQTVVIKCAAGKGIRGLRHSIGYLNITSTETIFMCKRWLRLQNFVAPRNKIEHVHFRKHLLMDRLTLKMDGKQHVFYLFKDASNRGETISRILCNQEHNLADDSTNQIDRTPARLLAMSQAEKSTG